MQRQGDPLVPAERAELVGLVDAQALDPEAPDAVAEHVDRQQLAAGPLVPLVEPEDQSDEAEVPQRLVEERRVERRARRVLAVAGRCASSISRAHGRSVGFPYSSWLK